MTKCKKRQSASRPTAGRPAGNFATECKMTKSLAAQTAVMGAHLGSKNAMALWDGLESHRSIGFVAPRFSRTNFMGACGARSVPVCTYNIYREVLGAGAAPTCCPHGGWCTRRVPRLCHFRNSAIVRGVGGGGDFPLYERPAGRRPAGRADSRPAGGRARNAAQRIASTAYMQLSYARNPSPRRINKYCCHYWCHHPCHDIS